jgi:DNA polymerase kappa
MTQFFESGQGSPSKKRQKLDHVSDDDLETSEHVLEEEQAMAEYEDDHDEQMLVDDEESGTVARSGLDKPPSSKQNPQPRTLTKPKSTSALSTTNRSKVQVQPIEGSATSNADSKSPRTKRMRAATVPAEERQVCPICSKVFDIDNAGLNEHIDFCLSKGAILAATAVTHGHSPKSKQKRQSS